MKKEGFFVPNRTKVVVFLILVLISLFILAFSNGIPSLLVNLFLLTFYFISQMESPSFWGSGIYWALIVVTQLVYWYIFACVIGWAINKFFVK